MKRLLVLLVMFGAGGAVWAQGDGGGRDVRVAMFSTHVVGALTMTGVGEDAWVARCAQCAHEALRTPLQVRGPGEWFAGGAVRVRDEGSGEERAATGLWHVRAGADGTDVVLTLPSERYVAAVLAAEAAPKEPVESLRALAVLVRTYALHGTHYTARPGHLAAELCDSTECQAMRTGPVSAAIDAATRETAGETLWFHGRRAEVFFSQNCAGTTEDAGAVWPKLGGVSYLRSHADPYCVRHGAMQWHAEVPLATLGQIAQAEGWHVPRAIVGVRVTQRTASHRASQITFMGSGGESSAVSATALRFGIGRALGWNKVESDAYELRVQGGSLVFDGRGRGHGVGLCQQGAAEMAAEGKSAEEILGFYFPGTHAGVSAEDSGWHETAVGGMKVRSVAALSVAEQTAIQTAWNEAQRRFVPRKAMTPEVVLAPSTEMFRQLTAQPGWMLADTRGSVIVLQPAAVLKTHGGMDDVLLHEMLHTLVEAEANVQTPLWLREGLVEVLAGEHDEDAHAMPLATVEGELRHPSSWPANERAHRAAGMKVKEMVGKYGLGVVRGWLGSGVPRGAGL